ncbi:Carbohydrate binding domain-containing protein [Stigmatella erecta]|uniref:Carbohydrate binding domain-containing protein n=1 Tax=Stigmatella erecta TaxID=83460 RepID=A0A1H9ZRX3_9BACT|nr:Carbohydrate binding domain-containing protein [Stigmatella erecta]
MKPGWSAAWKRLVLGSSVWAVGLGGVSCVVEEAAAPEATEVLQSEAPLESYGSRTLSIAGQPFTLTWEDDFGGDLNKGQPKSLLNSANWRKENLGVNYEQQAYTNRECVTHPNNWNYCVENGKLTLLARKEPLDCVVWQQCTATSQCGTNGTCAATGYCVYDQNRNGVFDHEECAPADGISNFPANGQQYTSGRIKSDEKVEFRYGYIEFRARMPFAELPAGATPPSGMWPAIWLLGANGAIANGTRDDSVGWPMNGEIDIMEYTQIKENKALYPSNEAMGFNALWREIPESGEMAAAPGGWQANACSDWPNGGDAKCDGDVGGARAQWPGKTIDYHQWHTWGFLWDEKGFKIYIDNMPYNGGTPVGTFTNGDSSTEFQQPMYLILNNAVGGELGCLGWSGRSCTSSAQCANGAACSGGKCQETPSSCINIDWAAHGDKAKLEVDYVRWFHRNSGYPQAARAACQDSDGNGTADNIIRNCGFNEDYTYHRSDLFFDGGQGLTDINNEGGSRGYVQWVRIDNSGWQPHSVQIRQEGFQLNAGTTYKWKVDVKSSVARTLPIKIAQPAAPYGVITTFNCNVGTGWTTCTGPNFTPQATGIYKFEITAGGNAAFNGSQIWVDDMYLGATTNACQPECTGKTCGSDGCGGVCGSCRSGTTCGSWGQCTASSGTCTPSCSGKTCGSDGCGGTCGTCSTGNTCNASGQCTPNTCTPQCSGKVCGSNGCGGTCGTCGSGTTCNTSGQCTPSTPSATRLEAESATLTGCFAEAGGDSGGKVVAFEGNDTICWSNVTLTGRTSATAHVGAPYNNGEAQLKFNGTVIGTLKLATATGGWSSPTLADISTGISASGTGTLCLAGVTHANGWIFSVDYLDLK